MGLFSFFKKEAKTSPEADGFPELFTGMRVEVLTPTGVSLFTGQLRLLGSDTLEVRAKGHLPRAVYGQPVRLQGRQEDGTPFLLDGSVGANTLEFWQIERLRLPRTSQHRESFRQRTGIDGVLYLAKTLKGQKRPCKVLDVSAGGARVVTKALFKPEDVFYLSLKLLPEESSFTIPCQVKRTQTHTKSGGQTFEYGCQFFDLPAQEQERLVQAIFTLQRGTLQARRNR